MFVTTRCFRVFLGSENTLELIRPDTRMCECVLTTPGATWFIIPKMSKLQAVQSRPMWTLTGSSWDDFRGTITDDTQTTLRAVQHRFA